MTDFSNASPWKKYARLGLIPALGGVLLAVVFWPAGDAPVSLKKPKPVAAAVAEKVTAAEEPAPLAPTASFTLDHALALNVFNPLNPKRKLAADGTVLTSDESPMQAGQALPASQVQAIFKNASGRAAIIDSRIVRVGDAIAAGRIVDITDDNVVIAAE